MQPSGGEGAAAIAAQLNILIPIATFVLGALVSRFTMTKAERRAAGQASFALSKELAGQQHQAFQGLTRALVDYAQRRGSPTVQELYEVSAAAQTYFYQQRLIADAILSDKIDPVSRDQSLVPNLVETVDRLIPKVYDTLADIAAKNSLPYPDTFKRENYESIYSAVEKYGRMRPPNQ